MDRGPHQRHDTGSRGDELRFSVSWTASCFADEAARDAWRDHSDDLSEEQVVTTLVDDLVARGVVPPDVAIDRAPGLRLIDEHVRYPAVVAAP